MRILRELTRLQHELGYLSDETLRDVAGRLNVPLYRIEGLVSFYPMFRRRPAARRTLQVCRDIACRLADGPACLDGWREALTKGELAHDGDVEIREVSCLGRCDAAPAAAVNDQPLAPASLADASAVRQALNASAGQSGQGDTATADVPRAPVRRLSKPWKADPYGDDPKTRYATVRALVTQGQLTETCLERLNASQLRGMGGAGFPTGRKWDLVRAQAADQKYVICNADESEPGTFKDRVLLEQLPHLVIEGMVLAALTIGATEGIIYLRHEYGREETVLRRALDEARRAGILGGDAAGSGHPFDVEIFVSPGGYILGEETALLEALEDKRGEPRNKPPYPGTHGLWGQPTLINNVETFALATSIIHHGTDWWREQGEGGFQGLKFVSLSGDIRRPGVYEIPIGTTVNRLIEMAGGMPDGLALRAFLPGGASSNFLTADHADTPLDFDCVKKAGSMLGTGAVIVFSEKHDLFAMAANIVRFFRNESCGKCVPCRLGTQRATDILSEAQATRLLAAQRTELEGLGETLLQTSICGLGQVAINPILSMLERFPDDVPE